MGEEASVKDTMTPSADAQGTCSLDSPASATRLLQEVEDMRGWSLGTGAACRAVGLEVGGVLSGLLRKRRGYKHPCRALA